MERQLIRPGRPGDIAELERLELSCFAADRLSRRSLRRFLSAPTTAVPVAATAEGLAGYAMVSFRAGSRIGRVFSLAVDASRRCGGIGRALLAACEAAARERGCTAVRLEVRADNASAVALYERAGYRPFGRYDDYYEDGAAALRFEKVLASTGDPD